MIAPITLDAESESRLESLHRALGRSTGLALFIVLADGEARGEVVRRLTAWAEMGQIPRVEVFPTGATGAALLDARLEGSDAPAAGWLLPDGDALLNPESVGLIGRFNQARDRLWRLVNGPVVLVLAPQHAKSFQIAASDLYEVRRGTWQLRAVPTHRMHELAMDPMHRTDLDALRTWARELDEDEREGRGQPSGWVDRRVAIAGQWIEVGALDEAEEQARHAETIARGASYLSGVAAALYLRGRIGLACGRVDEAEVLLAQAFETAKGAGDNGTSSASLMQLGRIATRHGQHEQALQHLHEGAGHATAAGDVVGLAMVRQLAAHILYAQGDSDRALREIREVIPILEGTNHFDVLAGAWGDLADFLCRRGALREAAEIFERKVIPLLERQGSQYLLAVSASKLGDVLELQGRLDDALRLHRDVALPILRGLGDRREEAVALGKIADVTESKGNVREALRIRQEEELPVFVELNEPRERAITEIKIVGALCKLDRGDEAEELLRSTVIPTFDNLGDVVEGANARGMLAQCLIHRGQGMAALRLLDQNVLPALQDKGEVHSLTLARLRKANALALLGRRSEAARLLTAEVIPAAKEMGIPSLLEPARQLLADVQSPVSGAFGVSPQPPRNRRERRAARRG